MTKWAEAVIIGGGIVGCSIAYNLARLGLKKICLFEKNYLASGATGRCGAGVRMQWGTRANCLLARESIRMYKQLPELLEISGDIEFKQGGYLLLAYTAKMVEQFQKNLALQNSLGIPARWVTPAEAKAIVPHLNTEGLFGATFCPQDGHCNPFAATYMYAAAARKLGVSIYTHTSVTGIVVENYRVKAVETEAGLVYTPIVVNAAGGYAAEINKLAGGAELPIYPERHEILVTEPVEAMQTPMVMSFYHNLYCQQVPHGSFLIGIGNPDEPKGINHRSSWQFLREAAQKVSALMPVLAKLTVVRQWAGVYDMTPDRQPILDEDEKIAGLFVAAGFSGHGFMIAPMVGRLMAELITGSSLSLPIAMFRGRRFAEGNFFVEPAVV